MQFFKKKKIKALYLILSYPKLYIRSKHMYAFFLRFILISL